jgi:hypothetical protein
VRNSGQCDAPANSSDQGNSVRGNSDHSHDRSVQRNRANVNGGTP